LLLAGLAACQSRDAVARRHMRESLRRLGEAEASYYAAHGTFTAWLDSLRLEGRPFAWSGEVRLIVTRADPRGWRAVASATWTEGVCTLEGDAPGGAALGDPQCR
jgi:hypothetical protein